MKKKKIETLKRNVGKWGKTFISGHGEVQKWTIEIC